MKVTLFPLAFDHISLASGRKVICSNFVLIFFFIRKGLINFFLLIFPLFCFIFFSMFLNGSCFVHSFCVSRQSRVFLAGESDVRDLGVMEEEVSRPTSVSRPSRPPSATSRPPSVASRHSTPVHPSQQVHSSPPTGSTATQLPAQVSLLRYGTDFYLYFFFKCCLYRL